MNQARTNIGLSITFLLLALNLFAQVQKETATMNQVSLSFMLDDMGKPLYAVSYKGKEVIRPSQLGMQLHEDSNFNHGFVQVAAEHRKVNENWNPVWGEEKTIHNQFEELTIHLRQKAEPGRLLNLVFRVFSDGVGFRYEFPKQPHLNYFIITAEQTQFQLTGDHKAFWIPGDYDTNEYPYTISPISAIDNRELVEKSTDIAVRTAPDRYAVQTPLMLKTNDHVYMNIHEAALVNYPAMQLHVDRSSALLTSSLVPDVLGNKAYVQAPFHTPWRTIIISDKAEDILMSRMILNLNEPSKIENTSWIHPMKFVGVWWEMQTGKSTWNYAASADSKDAKGNLIPTGRHGANTANVKKYIDFAAANQIKGVLVEGWNTGWEDWFGNWKDNVFDFVTPYPDFDIRELNRYAASKGVQIIMHNETSGAASSYERQIDTAFKLMNQFGYKSVKTGYVGRIIPRGEYHDGQVMVNHYNFVAQTAARHHVMLDAHEPVRPTGLQRTWPNWLACEASRGNEYNAFSIGNNPDHETILPFTRLMGGPMDYTPGIFKIKGYSDVPGRQVHSTLAKQLALYITLYSPLQMAADLPENYNAKKDAFQFIKDVPVDWDETRVLAAEPGEYIAIARKEKNKSNWYIGAITNQDARTMKVDFNFLDKGKKYEATVYADGPDADWKSNPESYRITTQTITSASHLDLKLAAGGGCAIEVKEREGNR